MCTSWRSESSSVLVAQSFFTSPRLFTSMPRSTRRRHHMHQHLPPLSSFPVDLQAFPPVASVPPPLVPPVNHSAPPPSPGAGIVPLVADCLTQLSGGPIITPATISSPAAVPALQRLASTPDAQLATLLLTVPLALFDSDSLHLSQPAPWTLRCACRHRAPQSSPLQAAGLRALSVIEHPRRRRPTASLGWATGWRAPAVLEHPRPPASAGQPGSVRSPLSSPPVAAAAQAPAEQQGGASSFSPRPFAAAAPASAEPPGGSRSPLLSGTLVAAAPGESQS